MSKITVEVDKIALEDIFAKKHTRSVFAIVIAADRELHEKYCPNSKPLYRLTEDIGIKDILSVLSIEHHQYTWVSIPYHLFGLIEHVKSKEKKATGRAGYDLKIIKDESGDISAKAIFEIYLENQIKMPSCVEAVDSAYSYFSGKVDSN